MTDSYAMQYVNANGGTSIFLCKSKESEDAITMKEKGIVDLFTIPDFSLSGELANYVTRKLDQQGRKI